MEDCTEVGAVLVNLLSFASGEAFALFQRVEVQFRIKGVTRLAIKADYVLAVIPKDTFPEISVGFMNMVTLIFALWIRPLTETVRAAIPGVDSLPVKELMTKADALMDSHFMTFKTSINASTPDKEDDYSTSTEADMIALGHIRLPWELFQTQHSLSMSADVRLVAGNGSAIPTYGHRITSEGVHSLPEKVAAIQETSTPSTVKARKEFLGMINYYHRLLPALAATFAPLYDSLKGKPKNLKWGHLQEVAFCNAKKALSTAAALTYPILQAPLPLSTDVQGRIGLFYLQSRITDGALGCPSLSPFLKRYVLRHSHRPQASGAHLHSTV
ncbi:uncharacterized protein [Palaemon carinicauda]|uniref:uncharacterized protein n=1 Tax=Palaemon carinicauda TaxID=392227 RepID=UPI0035B68EC8